MALSILFPPSPMPDLAPPPPRSRISHPKQRSRSIFISDSAVIARRDGILKFMFRVADIRRTQVGVAGRVCTAPAALELPMQCRSGQQTTSHLVTWW